MAPQEIYRSAGYLASEQRAFILHAVGIEAEIVDQGDAFALHVAAEIAPAAREHIERFEAELANAERPKPALRLHNAAWLAPALFALIVVVVGFLAGRALTGFDWYEQGALRGDLARSGEWWRMFTALTLHSDRAHLLSNIGFGAFFLFMCARLLGSGVAFGTTVCAAALGNWLDAMLMPLQQISIGASTMVFATLGLLSAYSWRLQFSPRMRWAHRWGPLVVGVMLLALIGSGGPKTNTDVLAHLAGFFFGVIAGVLYGRRPATNFHNGWLQFSVASAAVVAIAGAWWWAGVVS